MNHNLKHYQQIAVIGYTSESTCCHARTEPDKKEAKKKQDREGLCTRRTQDVPLFFPPLLADRTTIRAEQIELA